MGCVEDELADRHAGVELLFNLSLERSDVRLGRIDLSARKLPHAREMNAGLAPCQQESVVFFDDSGDDDHPSTRLTRW